LPGDGEYCYPLTIADQHSRYLLACEALDSVKGAGVRPVFVRLFREVGLPRAIRTDNGVPFATTGIHGLSWLNVWWIQLGIAHQRIEPSHPEQNGAHERMHRTLKAETTRPPAQTHRGQRRRFNRWRAEYNQDRPHEALGDKTPATAWRPSPRAYPNSIPKPHYPGHHLVRLVSNSGCFRWKARQIFVSQALEQQHIGQEETADGVWSIHFYDVVIANSMWFPEPRQAPLGIKSCRSDLFEDACPAVRTAFNRFAAAASSAMNPIESSDNKDMPPRRTG
jgi:hypothetical protein